MTPERYQEISCGGGTDLSGRAKWLLTGADAVRYLNGQVTNDVRKASPEAALHACVTSAKGRIEGDVFIHRTGDGLLLDAEPGLREALGARLEKYIVADDAVLRDVTEDWRLVHFFGRAREAVRGATCEGGSMVGAWRLGEAGIDLWLPVSQDPPPVPCARLSAAEVEILRIVRGIPRWPEELNLESFPQEAGLENSAMDFSKGCYIGQEVLSRIKSSGRMPRTLVRFEIQGPGCAAAKPGLKLVAGIEGAASREAGVVTSVCAHPELDRVVGLAYVRQGLEREHSLLLATEDPPNIVVEIFPSGP